MDPMKQIIAIFTLSFSSLAVANAEHPFYIAAKLGMFQGTYDQKMLDLTDIPPQNIGLTTEQHGYTGGIAIGYSKVIHEQYLLGMELSGNLDLNHAYFADGASSVALNDTTEINKHVDLTFVPGIFLNNSIAAYIKMGVSIASANDTVNSPAYVNFVPVMTNYTTNKNISGFAYGIGLKKFINDRFAIFIEGNYHDYGVIKFNNFQNFSATYSHSAHMYSYDGVLGIDVAL